MVRPYASLITLALIATALAGCFGFPDDNAPQDLGLEQEAPPFVDVALGEEGTARVYDDDHLRGTVRGACMPVPWTLRSACRDAVNPAANALPDLGTGEYEPALDLLSVSFQETPSNLNVAIQVASLDETFTGVVSDDGSTWGGWSVCWIVRGDDEQGWECTYLYGYRPNGVLAIEDAYDRYDPECNHWWWCSWHVPYHIEYGTPATVHLEIPRAIMGTAGQGHMLEEIIGFSFLSELPQDQATLRVQTPVHTEGITHFPYQRQEADTTDVGGPYTFTTPAADHRPGTASFAGTTGATARADTDLVEVELVETEQELTIAMRLVHVDPEPKDHWVYAAVGMPSGRVFQVGYEATGTDVEEWGGVCSDDDCSQWEEFPVTFTRQPGSLGWVNATVARSDLDSPQAGTLVNLFFTATGYWETEERHTVGPVSLEHWASPKGDWTPPSPPHWLQMDTTAE